MYAAAIVAVTPPACDDLERSKSCEPLSCMPLWDIKIRRQAAPSRAG